MSFECLTHEEHNALLQGDVLVGKLKKAPEFCPKGVVGCTALSAPSVRSFLTYLEDYCAMPKHDNASSRTRSGGYDWNSDFHKIESYDEAMDIFKNRPYEIQQFDPFDERLALPLKSGNEVNFDVTGDFFDMGRVLSGEPEAWGTFTDTNPRNLFATIVINLTAVWSIPAEAMMRRSFRMQRLVNWLENQNVRVQVKALQVSQCAYMEFTVKTFEQYLDLDSLAIAGHSDFFRRSMFRLMEWSDTWQNGYGTVWEIKRNDLKVPARWKDEPGIFLFTENQNSVEAVDQAFDLCEVRISEVLDGGRENLHLTF